MKNNFVVIFLMFAFLVLSCKKQEKILTMLTDDIFMLDVATLFQAKNSDFKVQVTLIEKNKVGIFSGTKKMKRHVMI